MIPSRIRVSLFCLALVACGDKTPKTVKFSDALPNLPLPPGASFVDRAGGADALQITMRSPASAETVTKYYREALKKGGWRLVNDSKDSDGATVLFAQRDGPPLWVRIRGAEGGSGTLVELSGAVAGPRADSGGAKATS
jgi:hypothetical protein